MSKSISKNAFFYALLNIFNTILPVIVLPIVSNAVGDTLYGYIGYGDSLNNYFLIFASFGVYTYGLREISRVRDDKEKLRSAFTSLFVITTITNILATVFYMGFVMIYYNGQPYCYSCIVMGMNLAFNLFYVEWVNQALENYSFITIKTMVVRIISCGLIILLIRNKENYLLYLYILTGTNFINNIISFVYVKRQVKFDFKHLEFKKHIKPMIFAVILSNVGVLFTQLDKFMIKHYMGTTEVGYYYMAQRVMNMINTLMLTLVTVTMPRLSNYLGTESNDKYKNLLNKVTKIYFLILFPASIGLAAVSNEVITVCGADYMPAVPVLIVFAIYMLSLGVQNIISNQIIYLYQKEKYDSVLILIGGIINLILNYGLVFAGKFTITGAIFTTLIANIITIIMQYDLVKRVIKLDVHLFKFENIKYLFYSLVFIPISIFTRSAIGNLYLRSMIIIGVSAIVYLIILIVTKDETFFEMFNKFYPKIKGICSKVKSRI